MKASGPRVSKSSASQRAQRGGTVERNGPGSAPVAAEAMTVSGRVELLVLLVAIALPIAVYTHFVQTFPSLRPGASAPPGSDHSAGMATALLAGAGAALAAALLTSFWTWARVRRGALAGSATVLYLGCFAPAVGGLILLAAPVVALLVLVRMALRAKGPVLDGLFLAITFGLCGSAACLFHRWPQYIGPWSFFVENAAALAGLIF